MKVINGIQWKNALISASNSMKNNEEQINAMNVFPVPDGDTGSNMSATIEYAVNGIKNLDDENIHFISNKFSKEMLLGARGNSGVILSQIFKGFTISFEGKNSCNSFDFVLAFDSAREYAYKSVMKPVEGTILTVIRLIAENLSKTITQSHTIIDTFKYAIEFAKEACSKTQELLPILKEVGVNDSGGEGFLKILEGIYSFLIGKPIEISDIKINEILDKKLNINNSFIMSEEDFSGKYGYCTEFIVSLKKPSLFDKTKYEKSLEKLGDSIVVVFDEDVLKTHLHTLNPGSVLTFAQKYGEFIRIKSENMTLMANESNSQKQNALINNKDEVKKEIIRNDDSKESIIFSKNKNKGDQKISIGIISCANGAGIIEQMFALGADFIVESGQTSNPSAKDLMQAIDSLETDQIFILPNNSNIILVAQQVAQISSKKIIVIPTKDLLQGIQVLTIFDESDSFENNKNSMEKILKKTKIGQVTVASKSIKINGASVRENEFLQIANRKILGSNKSKIKSAIKIIDKMMNEKIDFVSIYWGQDSTEADAIDVATYIETNYDVDVEIKNGGQLIFNFLIAFVEEIKW